MNITRYCSTCGDLSTVNVRDFNLAMLIKRLEEFLAKQPEPIEYANWETGGYEPHDHERG